MLPIRVNLGAVADLLIDHGHLVEWDAADRDKVKGGLERALATWSTYETS